MDQTTHERLTILADTYKMQQFKLTKAEIEEAATLLAQVLKASLGPAHDTADTFIRTLPADATTKAIGDSWSELAESIKQHLLKTIPNLQRGDRFDRLKLLAGAAILEVDSKNGTTFLCTSCTSLAPKSGSRFSNDVVQVFRKTFLDGSDLKLHKLAIGTHTSAVTGALLNLTLSALLQNSTQSPAFAPVFQLPVVKWFFSSQSYTHLKPAQQTQLSETIKHWDTTLQKELLEHLIQLPSGVPYGFEFLSAPAPTPQQPAVVAPPSAPPLTTTAPTTERPAPQWKDLLTELTSQITKLDQELQVAKSQSETTQAEAQTLRIALRNAENQISNFQDELEKKEAEIERITQAISTVQTAASQAEARAQSLETELAELKRNNEAQVQILNSRIETESTHRLQSFRHTLANTLRVDYGHFQLCEGKPPTPEIAQGLQMLVSGIFNRLQKHGINAKQ